MDVLDLFDAPLTGEERRRAASSEADERRRAASSAPTSPAPGGARYAPLNPPPGVAELLSASDATDATRAREPAGREWWCSTSRPRTWWKTT